MREGNRRVAVAATASGGPQSFTLQPASSFQAGESCTVTVVAAGVVDLGGRPMAGDHVFTFTIAAALSAIRDIQGASHISPLAGAPVTTRGIVTAKSSVGFYLQDPTPDADDATSEGIFVFTGGAPRWPWATT